MQNTLLPIEDLVSDDELRRDFHLVSVVPNNAPEWAYSIALPKRWVRDEGVERGSPRSLDLAQIGLFGPADQAYLLGVQVWAMECPFEIDLSDFLFLLGESRQMEFIEVAPRDSDIGQTVEILAEHLHASTPVLTRITAMSSGKQVFLVSSMSSKKHFEKHSLLFGVIALSFKPETEAESPYMEDLAFLEDPQKQLAFYFPVSWQAENKSSNTRESRIALRLQSDSEALAYLRVNSIGMPSEPHEVMERMKSDILTAGLRADHFELVEEDGRWGETMWVGECVIGGVPNDCVVVWKPFRQPIVAETDLRQPFGVASLLIAPRRSRNVNVWMRSKRALEIVTATSRPAIS